MYFFVKIVLCLTDLLKQQQASVVPFSIERGDGCLAPIRGHELLACI